MIKRPFLWGIVAFVAGILLAWYKIPLIYIGMLALVGWLITYLLMYYIKRYINPYDGFLWGLPILLLLGFLAMGDRMKPPDMDMAFEEKVDCSLIGEISMIVKKSWGIAYYLKNNEITMPDNNTYLVEEIMVNIYNEEPRQKYRYNEKQESNENLNSQQYLIGNLIKVSGNIRKFVANTNPGGFNEHLYYKSQNIAYKVNAEEIILIDASYSRFHSALNTVKESLIEVYNTILPDKEAGTLIAMVLGEKYLLEDEIKNLYQENGISHILAISGLHVSMVGAAIYYMLRKLRLGLVAAIVMSLAFVYSYGILTNFSVSTNRAVVMYSIMLLARLIGKTFDIISALSLSAFLILLQNPMDLFGAGFLLSFGAVLGIAIFLPCLNSLYEPKNALLKGVYVSISAQAFTLPFVLYYFFQIPIYSVFINLLVLPLTNLLMLTALVAGIVGSLSISLGIFLAGGANYVLKFYEVICRLGSNLPGNLITIGRPDVIRICAYFIILLIFIIGAKRYCKKRILMILVVAIIVLIIPKSRKGIIVTMLDVGQGEAIFIESDGKTTYLIDGGSSDVSQVGRYRITPYLLSRGIDELDYAIVTHTDMDHVSGLIELIEGGQISIKCLVLPETTMKNETYLMLETFAIDKAIELRHIVSGDLIKDGRLQMTFLHPAIGYQPASNNDYSAVISLSYGEFDMLLTGDIEDKGERELIEFLKKQEVVDIEHNRNANNDNDMLSSIQTDYDVLKVAHHGSKNSTSEELLKIVKPEYAMISCDKDNRYGHPHEELLERLDDAGSEVFITFESGAITVKTDGKSMVVEDYLK